MRHDTRLLIRILLRYIPCHTMHACMHHSAGPWIRIPGQHVFTQQPSSSPPHGRMKHACTHPPVHHLHTTRHVAPTTHGTGIPTYHLPPTWHRLPIAWHGMGIWDTHLSPTAYPAPTTHGMAWGYGIPTYHLPPTRHTCTLLHACACA